MIVFSPLFIRRILLVLLLGITPGLSWPTLATAEPGSADSRTVSKKKKRKKKRSRRRVRKKRRTKKKRIAKRSGKKRSVKKRRAKRSRRKTKAITAKTIRRWQKKGLSDRQIIALVSRNGGYRPTRKNWRKLKRAKVRKSLRRRLLKAERARRGSGGRKKVAQGPVFDLDAELDPNDIDFDSVAPPEGMDMEFADMHRQEAAQKRARRNRKYRGKRRRGKRRKASARRAVIAPPSQP